MYMLTVFASCITLVITVDKKKKKRKKDKRNVKISFWFLYFGLFFILVSTFFSLPILVQKNGKIIFNLLISVILVIEISKRSAPLIRWQT